MLIIGIQHLPGRLAAQLPGQFAPKGAHLHTVVFLIRFPRRNPGADQHHTLCLWQLVDAGFLQQLIHTGQIGRLNPGKQVIQGQHGMGLAATKVCLQLHHRVTAAPVQTQDRINQQLFQAVGQVGAAEKLQRLAVLGGALALVHLGEVGGELRLLVTATGHILVRSNHLTPGFQVACGAGVQRQTGLLPALTPGLFIKTRAQQFQPESLNCTGFRGRNGL